MLHYPAEPCELAPSAEDQATRQERGPAASHGKLLKILLGRQEAAQQLRHVPNRSHQNWRQNAIGAPKSAIYTPRAEKSDQAEASRTAVPLQGLRSRAVPSLGRQGIIALRRAKRRNMESGTCCDAAINVLSVRVAGRQCST